MNMRKKMPLLFAVLVVLFAISCNASTENSTPQDNKILLAANENKAGRLTCGIGSEFESAILAKDFTISAPEKIEKSEIPNIPDNIKSIKKIYTGKDDIFESFTTLSRFMIMNKKSNISARFYCFQFDNANEASSWFNVIDNAGPESERFVFFRKPKKLMALADDKVFLVEGYHIATYEPLHFLLGQLRDVRAILGPEKTIKP